jgi:heme exporter protein CcmD
VDFAAPHVGFVIAAYAISAFVLIGLSARIGLSLKARQRELKSLEERQTPRRRAGR